MIPGAVWGSVFGRPLEGRNACHYPLVGKATCILQPLAQAVGLLRAVIYLDTQEQRV